MSSADTTTTSDAAAEGEAEEPVERDELREELLDAFRSELGDAIVDSYIRPGDGLWIRVGRDAWQATADFARRRQRFEFFDFLSAVDWLPSPFGRDMDSQEDAVVHGQDAKEPAPMRSGYTGGDTRFQVLARVYSVSRHVGVVLKADVPDEDLRIDSWVEVYAGANWHERETWEMFGIDFVGHPGLTHIYLPTEFDGHPLRKDFPLLARRVKPWPGIVDVEPMPGVGDDEEETAG